VEDELFPETYFYSVCSGGPGWIGRCGSAERDWNEATKSNSVDSYQNFLKKHPSGKYADSAHNRLESVSWEACQEASNVDPCTSFLRLFPSSSHKPEASRRIAEEASSRVAEKGELLRIESLIAAKRDIGTKDSKGATELINAAMNGYLDVVRTLLAANANVNATDNYGNTALINAAENSHLDVVKVLLAAKANVNAADGMGFTALMMASQCKNPSKKVADDMVLAQLLGVDDKNAETTICRRRRLLA